MEVPIHPGMATQDEPVAVRLEERTEASFDLSGEAEYVDLQEISGRLVLDFEVNRGELMELIERVEDPGLKEQVELKLRKFLEDWSLPTRPTEEFELDYGTLLLEGTEPLDDLDEEVPLRKTIDRETLETSSPSDLRRELRDEVTYETSHEKLVEDIEEYLWREGVNPDDAEFSEPFQVQARAQAEVDDENPELTGNRFFIEVTNNRAEAPAGDAAATATVYVSMPPEIGREVSDVSHDGSYDPADQRYEFELGQLHSGDSEELEFLVPVTAGRDLEELEGDIEINMDVPFTYLNPGNVFDASGRKLTDGEGLSLNVGGLFEASFYTPTSAIMKEEAAEISKRIMIEGITPPQAKQEVDSILARRGINADEMDLKEETKKREGDEVTTFNGRWENGSVLKEDTRIAVSVWIEGERRSGELGAEVEESERLPSQQRNVSMSYGRTGIEVKGHGADYQKVEEYVTDLRDEIKLTLENQAVEV